MSLVTSKCVSREQQALEILSSLSYRTGELPDYLGTVVQGVSGLLSIDWSVVTLCEADSEKILASNVDIGDAMDKVYPLHGTLTGTVVTQGCPLSVPDTKLDQSQGQGVEGYRAYLGVPLKLPTGKIIGTICSFHQTPRTFSPDDVRLAELFAERAAIAIDNYQLFQQQQQLNERLAAEIAERKEAEAALRLSENRFRALVEQATDAFYVVCADLRILDVNRQACLDLGYSREALLQMRATDIQVSQDDTALRQLLNSVTPGHPVTVEGYHRRQDGSTFPVEVSITEIDLNGKTVYLALARDISDRKQAEADRERLAEIGELASMIVHEVRNPLTTVWMAIKAMQGEAALSNRSTARLTMALDEAERLQGLLNDILLYAKPEQNLDTSDLEINQFITEVVESLRQQPAIATRHIHWTPTGKALALKADSNKLKQVLINLITNACEAINDGDKISCWVELAKSPGYLTICVHNGGEPIPVEILPRLTQPFFTTKSSGNGLGLAITKRIIEAHGGQFMITSSAETGTQVSVQLPYLA
ncbi:MAG: PAS domain S-box protein [Cyanobacteria bacterium P01_G01_bin.38]